MEAPLLVPKRVCPEGTVVATILPNPETSPLNPKPETPKRPQLPSPDPESPIPLN